MEPTRWGFANKKNKLFRILLSVNNILKKKNFFLVKRVFFFLVIGKNFSINLMMVYNLIYLDTLTSLHIIFYLQFKQSLSKGIIKGKKNNYDHNSF